MNLSETLQYLHAHSEYRRLDGLAGLQIDLKYASTDNFMGKNVYGVFNEAFLHRVAAAKLERAVELLVASRPGWKFLVLDALRPRSIQRILWSYVEGTPQEPYVANPDRGSVHNYGLAVDLTCVDARGEWVDMGSGFDAFVTLSEPRHEERFLASGELTRAQVENRMVLRRAMTGAGFLTIPHEWWHFDALPRPEIREGFTIIE